MEALNFPAKVNKDHPVQNSHLKSIVTILSSKISNLKLVYLFGSGAKGNASSFSDIDVAFLSENPIENLKRWDIQEQIARRLNRDIDLVDMKVASDIFLKEIIYHGKLIFRVEEFDKDSYECRVMENYLDLKNQNREIYQRISRSRSIFS